jgi:hypothetical protein
MSRIRFDLFLEHVGRQPERGNLRAHHAAAERILLEEVHLVAVRQQVVGHRQRGGPGAEQGHPLAVLLPGHTRQIGGDVALVVGGHALQPADGHRLLLGAHPAAGRLAGPVAGAPEDAREDVGVPVEHVRFGVALLGDQADVLGHGRVAGQAHWQSTTLWK